MQWMGKENNIHSGSNSYAGPTHKVPSNKQIFRKFVE